MYSVIEEFGVEQFKSDNSKSQFVRSIQWESSEQKNLN